MINEIEILGQTPLFQHLPTRHLQELGEYVRRRHFADGEMIFQQGDPSNSLFIVASGEVKVSLQSRGDNDMEIVLAILKPGDMLGEMGVLDGAPRSASATAEGEAELLMLARNDVNYLLEREPSAMRAVLNALVGMIRRTNEKISDFFMRDVHGRLAKAFFMLAERYGKEVPGGIRIDHLVTHEDLAGLAGLHRVEVDRLMQGYQLENFIDIEDGHIVLKRVADMRAWV